MAFNLKLYKRVKIREDEIGLHFHDGEFRGLLSRGDHKLFDPYGLSQVNVVSTREPALIHDKLDVIVRSNALEGKGIVVDLKDHERALVWIDGRFAKVLTPGLHVYWTTLRNVRVEVVDARQVRFQHADFETITRQPAVEKFLMEVYTVASRQQGVLHINGEFVSIMPPGRYAFWKNMAEIKFTVTDMREVVMDVAGQDIITADKVTLRINAMVNCRVADPCAALNVAENAQQALYRDVQLALRAIVGSRELDAFLADKDTVAKELADDVRGRAGTLGLELISVGIRDVILPGEMRELMNKVTEAKKAAEANLIARREETAAMRSQANTAKLLQENPTLMRLRELEVLEKIASHAKLNVTLSEKGLADRVVNLL